MFSPNKWNHFEKTVICDFIVLFTDFDLIHDSPCENWGNPSSRHTHSRSVTCQIRSLVEDPPGSSMGDLDDASILANACSIGGRHASCQHMDQIQMELLTHKKWRSLEKTMHGDDAFICIINALNDTNKWESHLIHGVAGRGHKAITSSNYFAFRIHWGFSQKRAWDLFWNIWFHVIFPILQKQKWL